jgi:galactose mutarotase-like enzyme
VQEKKDSKISKDATIHDRKPERDKACVTNYGGRIFSLYVPDKRGNFEDIVLGMIIFPITEINEKYYGAIIGRYGNRIAMPVFPWP